MLLGAAPLEQRPPVKVSLVMYTLVYPHEHPAAFVTGHIFEAKVPVEVSAFSSTGSTAMNRRRRVGSPSPLAR